MKIAFFKTLFLRFMYKTRYVLVLPFLRDAKKKNPKNKNENETNDNVSINWSRDQVCKYMFD